MLLNSGNQHFGTVFMKKLYVYKDCNSHKYFVLYYAWSQD
jgi:hypothetical protein